VAADRMTVGDLHFITRCSCSQSGHSRSDSWGVCIIRTTAGVASQRV